jgi:hypothetical protein
MNPERWKQIEELYHAALERAEGERAGFLEQACGGDAAQLSPASGKFHRSPGAGRGSPVAGFERGHLDPIR